jgi:hypothetical protein
MDLLFSYNQQKKDKNRKTDNQIAQCLLRLYIDGESLCYEGIFDFDYDRYSKKRHVTFEHNFVIDITSGDVSVTYKIINDGLTDEKFLKSSTKFKKNDFKLLFDLVENGIARGEKRRGFWGVKYDRSVEQIIDIMISKLRPNFKSEFYLNKNYKSNSTFNTIYDLMVDYHLDLKGIKAHNGIYYDIQNEYPKKKWLIKNDYKYVPSVLDYYGIKCKYLVSELTKTNRNIQISSLNYLCKLFGKNYVDYLKKIFWDIHCYDAPPNKKIHELKNEFEKECLVKVINTWETDTIKTDSLIYTLNKIFMTRELLEQRGLDLKFRANNDIQFDNIMEMWSGLKLYYARGYKVKYIIPEDFIKEMEEDILIGDLKFKPKILLTEEDFRLEGFNMKNCMSKQFAHGAIYMFVSLQHKRKRINLQYRRGNLIQSYGKANTPVISIFEEATNILTSRFKKYPMLEWKKEKYEFITNSLPMSK